MRLFDSTLRLPACLRPVDVPRYGEAHTSFMLSENDRAAFAALHSDRGKPVAADSSAVPAPTPLQPAVQPNADVPAAVEEEEEEEGKDVIAGDNSRHRTMSHPRGTSLAAEALAAEAATQDTAAGQEAEEHRHRTMSRPRGSSLAAEALAAVHHNTPDKDLQDWYLLYMYDTRSKRHTLATGQKRTPCIKKKMYVHRILYVGSYV